ncbi:uncharacterized protein LOC132699735 [Cylas formicarius]|uniref:uncharacterized protein LOC132699735 n=1 Tax=Cylas formicarius TaxID=197179 RepID=UPI002958A25F|nr:uncharacterized protein LOC132699735 [Cylas formicarius]
MSGKILYGKKSSVPKDRNMGMGQLFFEQAEKIGDQIFQIDADTDKMETYREVKTRSVRVAIELRKLGIESKDVVLICCKNNLDNIVPLLASFYLGAYVASADPKQTSFDVDHILGLVEPKVIFVVEDALDLIQQSLKLYSYSPAIVVIGKSNVYKTMADMEEKIPEEDNFRPLALTGDHIALISFSSGTTSTPKGICVSHYAVLYGWTGTVEHNAFKPDVFLHRSSLYWGVYVIATALSIAQGYKVVVGTDIDAQRFLQIVDKYKVTSFFTSNMFSYEITSLGRDIISKYDLSSLYSFLIGGSPVEPRQILKLRELLPGVKVALIYGSTEANTISTFDFTDEKAYDAKVSSSGTLLPDIELKVVDVETSELLGPNQQGEILVRNPYIMSGYYHLNKPDSYDNEGFLKQGDLGYYDEDGYIYVRDRVNETFKYLKDQVSPSLIENVLMTHPSVKEAVVIGVPHPIDTARPAACIVVNEGVQVDLEELVLFVNSKMPDNHHIRAGIKIVDEIPRTPTGKVRRRAIRDLFVED